MIKTRYLILLCALFCGIISVQAQEIIPFRLTKHHNIIVKGLINDIDSVDLMFQIAMREASLAPNRKHKVESVKFDTSEFPEGLSKVNRLKVASTQIDSLWIWDNEYTGYEAEGKIGTFLFKGKIFKINYSDSQFELYNQLPSVTGYHKIPLTYKDGQIFIEVSSFFNDNELKSEFLMQSGFSGAILYKNQVSDDNLLAQELAVIEEKTMSNSAGQKLTSLICKMPEVELGSFSFENVPVSIFTGEIKNQRSNYIGADLIHRFNWVIDIKGGMAYIQKNDAFGEEYYFDKK